MLFFNSVVDVIVARAAADHTNASAPSWRSPAMLRSGVLGVRHVRLRRFTRVCVSD
jgi:hypothetical protein